MLHLIHKNVTNIPHNELGFIYMALRKFNVAFSSDVLRDIYMHLLDNVGTMDIETLSYMSVGLRSRFHQDNHRLVWRLALVEAMPRLQHHLLTCTTISELRQIVICFNNLNYLISDRMMDQLMDKVTMLMEGEEWHLEAEKVPKLKLLDKLLSLMLAKVDWHEDHGDYVYKLLYQFKGNCKHLRPVNACILAKVIKNSGEPVSVMYELYERLAEIIRNKEFIGHVPMITVLNGMLKINPSAVPLKKIELIIENIIESPHLSDHVDDVFQILRNVGIINNALVERFFLECFEALKSESGDGKWNKDGGDMIRLANRYLQMHNTYSGKYLNHDFEEKIVQYLLEELEEKDPTIYHPRAFGSRISMLLQFGKKLDEGLIKKFMDFLPNYNAQTLLSISKAIDTRLKKFNQPLNRKQRNSYIEMLEELNVHVNKASELKLRNFEILDEKLVDIADLMRNYIYRNDFFNEQYDFVKEKVIEKIDGGHMSTRYVGLLCSAVNNPRRKLESPELLESFVNFYLNRQDPKELHSESVYKLLEICFDSGHVPNKKFLELFSDLLKRDIDSLSGLRTLTIAFMLSCYDSVSRPLITAIFSNEFMNRLDNELEMASDRKHYPKILRKALMILNRAVVLRNPEYGVPWFHSKYCAENQMYLRAKSSTDTFSFKEEVSEHLASLLGGWRYYKENTFSQYYNNIDFEVHFDSRGKPLDLTSSLNVSDEAGVTKVAVQVIPANMMTVDTRKVAGHVTSNNRELELQGWRVITVNPFLWNSMQMGDYSSKNKYLKEAVSM